MEYIIDIFSSEILQSVLLMFFGSFFMLLGSFATYLLGIRGKTVDRLNKVDNALIERRMQEYRKAEKIRNELAALQIVSREAGGCEVIKKRLHLLWGKEAILHTIPIYSNIESTRAFKIKINEMELILLDDDIVIWLKILQMYNENFILADEKLSIPKWFLAEIECLDTDNDLDLIKFIFIEYLNLTALYDTGLIYKKMGAAIQNFYASKDKIRFKKTGFIRNHIIMYRMWRFFNKATTRSFYYGKKCKPKTIMRACISCTEDCSLAGKNIVKKYNSNTLNTTI